MKKYKLKLLLYIFFLVIFVFAIISLKNKIKNYDSNNSNNYNNYDISGSIFTENANNTNNTDNIDNSYNTDSFTKATVKRVVDGDTIVVLINNDEYKVRLIGVNSPESTTKVEEYGKEASNYTTNMLTGKTVYLEKDVSETDKYGRLLRYVWLQVPAHFSEDEIKEKMFNAILVLNGYAQAATYPPDVKYANYFKEFANTARTNNVGLWK